jgi:DNA-binding PadR family transcriptional regulator
MFDYGELRLLVLALLSEQPRHGYDLIREIEERTGGSYTPSPGVIYPTLQWLEDMGYARVSDESAGRKSFLITPEGASFLVANQAALDGLLARITAAGAAPGDGVPEQVTRAVENLKVALRLRLRRGLLEESAAETIAAALDAAARAVERS